MSQSQKIHWRQKRSLCVRFALCGVSTTFWPAAICETEEEKKGRNKRLLLGEKKIMSDGREVNCRAAAAHRPSFAALTTHASTWPFINAITLDTIPRVFCTKRVTFTAKKKQKYD